MNTIIVRKQTDIEANAIVTLRVFDKNANKIFAKDYTVPALGTNASYVIAAGEDIILPDGGSYTVSFTDANSGSALATTLIIK